MMGFREGKSLCFRCNGSREPRRFPRPHTSRQREGLRGFLRHSAKSASVCRTEAALASDGAAFALCLFPAIPLVPPLSLSLVASDYVVKNPRNERRVKPNAITLLAIMLGQLPLLVAP